MAEPEDEAPPILLPCTFCTRTFKPESLEKHRKVCEKHSTKKRKVFDSSKQRIQGTELAEFLPQILREKKSEKVVIKKSESHWKEKHLEFVAAIRAARGVEPTSTKSSSAVSKSSNEKCPHCDRYFGPKAFDRHIEWCKEQKARIPKSPASLIQAKERLEARTKYRAPPLAKSKRTLTREKYARVPQHSSKESSPLGSRSAVAFSKPQLQDMKVLETSPRIPGIRSKPKLSSSSPSCTLPSGSVQVKRREPSPSPSKKIVRSGSKTARKGPIKPKNEETNNHASLFTSSCNITKIQPSDERQNGREIKPNPVESRPFVRKPSPSVLKTCKQEVDPAAKPSSFGAQSSKCEDESTSGSSFPADGHEQLHEKTSVPYDRTQDVLLGESLQIKGSVCMQEGENRTSSDSAKRLSSRIHGTIRQKPKLNSIGVNRENDGLIVFPCSIFQSCSKLVAGNDNTKSKQENNRGGDSGMKKYEYNATFTLSHTDCDVQIQKAVSNSNSASKVKQEEVVCKPCSEGLFLDVDCCKTDPKKYCVDFPRFCSGDSVCKRDKKLSKNILKHDLYELSYEGMEFYTCSKEFPSATELKEFSNTQENVSDLSEFVKNGPKSNKNHTMCPSTFSSVNEKNEGIDDQHKVDYQSHCTDPVNVQEKVNEANHCESHFIKERYEENLTSHDSSDTATVSAEETNIECKQLNKKNDINFMHSTKCRQKSATEGGEHLKSQMSLFVTKFNEYVDSESTDNLTVVNEKEQNSVTDDKESCLYLQKSPYAFEFSKNTDVCVSLEHKGDLASNAKIVTQNQHITPACECVFFTKCNECSDEHGHCRNHTGTKGFDKIEEQQYSWLHRTKEKLSENTKKFDIIFSASEFEAHEMPTAKFNGDNFENIIGVLHRSGDVQNTITEDEVFTNPIMEFSDLYENIVAEDALKSENSKCSPDSQKFSTGIEYHDCSNMQRELVNPAYTRRMQGTIKGGKLDLSAEVSSEESKQCLNNHELTIPFADADISSKAVSFDVQGNLSLLCSGNGAQIKKLNSQTCSEILYEPSVTTSINTVNNSLNGNKEEMKFPSMCNRATSNICAMNEASVLESFLLDVPSDKNEGTSMNCNAASGDSQELAYQHSMSDNSCIKEEIRNNISVHDDTSEMSDSQFSDEYESVLITDFKNVDGSHFPFCKKSCLCCFEKDKIQQKVCNVWKSCGEEDSDFFAMFGLPENLSDERYVDCSTDHVWDLASLEFIKNVNNNSSTTNSDLYISVKSYSSGESSTDKNDEFVEAQKIPWNSNWKMKNNQSCPPAPILFETTAFHHSKGRRNFQNMHSSILCQMKKYKKKSQRRAKQSYELEEPVVKKRLLHNLWACSNSSDISAGQQKTSKFRNTLDNAPLVFKNDSSCKLNSHLDNEDNAVYVFGEHIISNFNMKERFDENSKNIFHCTLRNNENDVDMIDTDNFENENVSIFESCCQLHNSSIERNRNSCLKTAADDIVALEMFEERENEDIAEVSIVRLPYRRDYALIIPKIRNIHRVTPQAEQIFRYAFDIMKYYMLQLLCSSMLRNVISTYVQCLPNRRFNIGGKCLMLPLPSVSDETQNNDHVIGLKPSREMQNVYSTVTMVYNAAETGIGENDGFSASFISDEENDKYVASKHGFVCEEPSLIENCCPEASYISVGIFKEGSKLFPSFEEEEECKNILRNCVSQECYRDFECNEFIPEIHYVTELNDGSDNDLKSYLAHKLNRDREHIILNRFSEHCLNKAFMNEAHASCKNIGTNSCDPEFYEFPLATSPPQSFVYEGDANNVKCNWFSEILGIPLMHDHLDSNMCCGLSQEFVSSPEFGFLYDSSCLVHLPFEYIDNNNICFYPLCSQFGNDSFSGIVINEVQEITEDRFTDGDLPNGHGFECNDRNGIVDSCASSVDETSNRVLLNEPLLEEEHYLYNFNYFNESKKEIDGRNLCMKEVQQTNETSNSETQSPVVLSVNGQTPSESSADSNKTTNLFSAMNNCYHCNEFSRSIFILNFPSFLNSNDDNFDVKVWTRSIKIPRKNIAFSEHSVQSSSVKSYGAKDDEGLKINFRKKVAKNMLTLQQNNDCVFEYAGRLIQNCNISVLEKKKSGSFSEESVKCYTDFTCVRGSGTNKLYEARRSDRSDVSLYELAMNVKGIIQSDGAALPKVQVHQKHKIKSAKEHDTSLLKLVEKWSTKDKILLRSKSAEATSKNTGGEYVQNKKVPKTHKLPPLSTLPNCSFKFSSSGEVYDPYVSAERQMMELLSQGDFTQPSPQKNKKTSSSHADSSAVFPSFETSHQSAFVSPETPRVFPSPKSHLEKGDADKRITEEVFMLKSESSISSELFTQPKSHSAGAKFSADSAYGSLNRRSPSHTVGNQMPGKHEEIEGDRMCFMSSSSSESSLPPLCTVQVVKREPSNPSISPSPPHAIDTSPLLQSAPRMSKFCHECGSKYPVSLAKFCCECGVRRLIM